MAKEEFVESTIKDFLIQEDMYVTAKEVAGAAGIKEGRARKLLTKMAREKQIYGHKTAIDVAVQCGPMSGRASRRKYVLQFAWAGPDGIRGFFDLTGRAG